MRAFAITITCLLMLATGLLVVLGDGNPALGILPLGLALVALALVRVSLAGIAAALVFVSLMVENPQERPGMGAFTSFLHAPGKIFYVALDASLKLPGVKLFGIEVLFGILMVLVFLRARNRPLDEPLPLRPASALTTASMWAVVTLLLLEVYGIATGGDVRFSMLQLRPLLFGVGLPFILAHCFDQTKHAELVVRTLLLAALGRALMGIYYWATIMRHGVIGDGDLGGGTYVLTHSDSVLSAVAILYCFVRVYERPSWRAVLISGVVVPVVGFFMIVNNRRLAFVAVVLGVAAIYFAADRIIKRRVHLTVLLSLPLLIGYVAAGWTSTASWAKPVQTLRSVIVQEDSSSETRSIENYNLMVTLKRKPLIGWGLGHPYVEHVKAHDISKFFEAYLYVPHNSVLWLWSAGSVPGSFPIFALLAVGVFLAIRIHRTTSSSEERSLALLTVGTVVTYGVQAFGDMGLQSFMASLVLGTTLGWVGHAAVRTGAWPSRTDPSLESPAEP